MKKIILLICCAFLFLMVSCSSKNNQSVYNNENFPAWVFKPSMSGKKGAVGVAKPHIKGMNAQKQLAVERAVDELAKQQGVKVQNIRATMTKAMNQSSSTSLLSSFSVQTTQGKVLRFRVKEFWIDNSERFYAWVTLE